MGPEEVAVNVAEQASIPDTTGSMGGTMAPSPDSSSETSLNARVLAFITRFGLLVALVLVIAYFGIREPNSFLTLANLKSTASIAAPLLVLAVGLTVPLSMGEFDLSISNATQLWMAVVVWFMVTMELAWPGAIVITLLAGMIVGAIIGTIVVRSRVNAFIITLGAGTILAGIEFGIAKGATTFGVPSAYADLATGRALFDIPNAIPIALVFALLVWVGMERTVPGRKMRATGGNAEAARLAGVRVDLLRASGFVVTGLAAGIAAVLLSAQSASYYPNAASAMLLPAYAACFLGTTVFRSNIFDVAGTLVGVAFLAVIQSGLIMIGVESWIAQVVQGTLLILAVVISKLASKSVA